MKNIFIINGSHPFAHSGGRFNETLFNNTISYFDTREEFEVKFTQVGDNYDVKEEVEKFKWADIVIYHTPIWWFQIPFGFKKYIDEVFTEGHQNGIYASDGRSRKNPNINYGTGGLMHGKKYILTTSWNAPKTAFTLENEFFNQKSVDEGVMFGFHRMNAFTGMELLATHHFHDMEKNADVPLELNNYSAFLNDLMVNL
ncbi:NAD(P)H-dependent oxidoreductase [Algibacter lectus]|uniref:Modulator of drug activity B n=1 Tax=Algibacter lectus TaxID=221126 RepID=A0A090VHZ4_9FLAO|nr:NAD(P)H-dependent oxidoreductase [Algibacter lectus]MWW25933.1 NADPH quinone reductase MdaB [Algibacter lectus]TDY60659.1 modulator of drug activity B [Algibacter lectus]GAL64361.1 modulator of drug activity B [Algibacter lectus]SFD30407.1 modulator of drug activity B [Algibacter lectus]